MKTDVVPAKGGAFQGMTEETATTPLEVKAIAEKALRLQRHLLRRAWGALYAAYSVSMFLAVFGGLFIALPGLPVEELVAEHLAVSMLASALALTVTLWAFKRVRDTAEIRNFVVGGRWTRVIEYRVLMPAWVAVYAIVLSSFFVFGSQAGAGVVLAVYAAFWGFLLYAQRLSFPGNLPAESIATLSSFGIAVAGTIVNTLSVNVLALDGLLWGAMVVVWVASAFYARTRGLPGHSGDRAV